MFPTRVAQRSTVTDPRGTWIPLLAIFLVAWGTRLLFLWSSPDRAWPHSILYEGDAPVWVEWARELARGRPFEFDLPLRAPGAAYLLHWLGGGLAGDDFVRLKVVWCAASALTCALLFAAVRDSLGARTAWIAGGLCAFSFSAYVLATSLNNEAWYGLGVVALVAATQRFHARPTWFTAAALGLLHGALTLLRAEHTLLLAAMLLYGLARGRRDARTIGPRLALVAAVAIATCLPWSLRGSAAVERFNTTLRRPIPFAQVSPPWDASARAALDELPAFAREGCFLHLSDLARAAGKAVVTRADVDAFFRDTFGYRPEPLSRWTLVSSKGALDFALANHPGSRGGFSRAALGDRFDADPEFSFGRPSHLELYNHGLRIGLGWIAADLPGWFALAGRKFARFADGATLGFTAFNVPCGREGQRRPVDMFTRAAGACGAFQFLAVAVILAGIALAVRRGIAGIWLVIVAYKLAVTLLFYGYARQAASIQPAFLVFAALALSTLWMALEARAPWLRAHAARIGCALVGAALALEISAFAARPGTAITAHPADPATRLLTRPEWGPTAFTTHGSIHVVRPAAAPR